MIIAIINTEGQIVKSGDHRAIFPNTSFRATGPSDEFLSENSAVRVEAWKPHDSETEKLVQCDIYLEDGVGYVVRVEPISQQDIDAAREVAANEVRAERNRKLQECDWTILPDSPVSNREAWATYRQELRNVTSQPGFPSVVIWPVSP